MNNRHVKFKIPSFTQEEDPKIYKTGWLGTVDTRSLEMVPSYRSHVTSY